MSLEQSKSTSAAADEANLLAAQNIIDLGAAREAAEQDARRLAFAEHFREMAQSDFENNIQRQPGGYGLWSSRMGDGPVTYVGAADYRNGWYQALQSRQIAETTEQAS